MPIKPENKKRYPSDWNKIAMEIKEEAGWCCECCGKPCYKPGQKIRTRRKVLTVHHLNLIPEDCRPDNLVAVCGRCHLQYHREARKNGVSISVAEHFEMALWGIDYHKLSKKGLLPKGAL